MKIVSILSFKVPRLSRYYSGQSRDYRSHRGPGLRGDCHAVIIRQVFFDVQKPYKMNGLKSRFWNSHETVIWVVLIKLFSSLTIQLWKTKRYLKIWILIWSYLFLKVLLLFSTISALDNEELSKELDLKAQELAQGTHYFFK